MIFIWLKRPIDNVLNFMRARNIHVKKSAIVIFALTGVITLGGAAIYLRRKRRRNQPDKSELPAVCKEPNFSVSGHTHKRGSGDSCSRRCISTSSTINSSIGSSPRRRLSRTTVKSPSVEKAHILYAEGVEEFQTALSKLEQAAVLIEDDKTSMMSETASSITLFGETSQDTIRCYDQDSVGGPGASTNSSQVDSVVDYSECSSIQDSGFGTSTSTLPSVTNHDRVSLDKLEEQLQSIMGRVHQLPDLDEALCDFDADETMTMERERCVSECSNVTDAESTTSWFSARDSWEIRSTDFALESKPKRLKLLEEGYEAVSRGEVAYRKCRTERVECRTDEEYLAKLHCLRIGLTEVSKDKTVKRWMEESGRLMIESILCSAGRNCDGFKQAYEKLVNFCRCEDNLQTLEEELRSREVVEMTFFDVVIDYILMDAFEHLDEPPSAVTTITHNRWLSDSLKESAITTCVWSILKAKRRTLARSKGFIAHLYDVTAHITPDLVWGFLGPETPLKNACYRFKEEMTELVTSIFNERRVRYTNKHQMADDLIKVMRERFKSFMAYMHGRVLKDQIQLST